jgi:hypothetical protein
VWLPLRSLLLNALQGAPAAIRAPDAICVATDLGDGYLKAIGNPEGEHVLACGGWYTWRNRQDC